MPIVTTDNSNYAAIAAAIRAKNKSTQTYLPSEMAAAINAISTGSFEDEIITREISGTYTNDRITKTGEAAFQSCKKLTEVNLPNVTFVEHYSFYRCSALDSISIPKMTSARDYAFAGTAIKNASWSNISYVGWNCFQDTKSLVSVEFPKLKSLNWYAFKNSSIQRAEFAILTTITNYSFMNCTNFDTLILRASTLCTLGNTAALQNTKIAAGTGYIYVPDKLVDSYKAATNWVTYADQIKPISELEAT